MLSAGSALRALQFAGTSRSVAYYSPRSESTALRRGVHLPLAAQGLTPVRRASVAARVATDVEHQAGGEQPATPGSTQLAGGAAGTPAAPPLPSLPVTICVPECTLQFGEHLVLAGDPPQLGAWQAAEALSLEWREGDNWIASLALPPGEYKCKLVVVRQDGSVYWEDGDDRVLSLPADATSADYTLQFGDTSDTFVLAPRLSAPPAVPPQGADPGAGAPSGLPAANGATPAPPTPAGALPFAPAPPAASVASGLAQRAAPPPAPMAPAAPPAVNVAAPAAEPAPQQEAPVELQQPSEAVQGQMEAAEAAAPEQAAPSAAAHQAPPAGRSADAQAQVSELKQHTQQLAAQIHGLGAEAKASESGFAPEKRSVKEIVAAELARLEREREMSLAALAADAAAAAPAASAPEAAEAALEGLAPAEEAPAAAEAPPVPETAQAPQPAAAAPAAAPPSVTSVVRERASSPSPRPASPIERTRLKEAAGRAATAAANLATRLEARLEAASASAAAAAASGQKPPVPRPVQPAVPVAGKSTTGVTDVPPLSMVDDGNMTERAQREQQHLQQVQQAQAQASLAPAEVAPAAAEAAPAAPAPAAPAAEPSTSDDGVVSFCFDTTGPQVSSQELARQRARELLPPATAAALERRLARMAADAGGATAGPEEVAQEPAANASQPPRNVQASAMRGRGRGRPAGSAMSSRSGSVSRATSMLQRARGGGRAVAAAAGNGTKQRKKGNGTQNKGFGTQQQQVKAGSVSLPAQVPPPSAAVPLADEPPTVSSEHSDKAGASPAPPSPTAVIAPTAPETAAKAEAASAGAEEVLRLFDAPTEAAPEGKGQDVIRLFGDTSGDGAAPQSGVPAGGASRAAPDAASWSSIPAEYAAAWDWQDEAFLRGSTPMVVLVLVLTSVYGVGELLWSTGRSVVPEPARRAADVAFWVVFSALLATPWL